LVMTVVVPRLTGWRHHPPSDSGFGLRDLIYAGNVTPA